MMAFDAAAETEDDALMVLFANGDHLAAATLAHRHSPRVLALATRMLHDRVEAEDVTQEAMLRLWRIAPDWRQGEAKVSTWLYRVAANLCTDRLRRRRSTDLETIPEPADDTPGIERRLMDQDRAQALEIALQSLPERQRMAVTLRHLQELSNPEIAHVMDLSVEAVESLIARGKRQLRSVLQQQKAVLGREM